MGRWFVFWGLGVGRGGDGGALCMPEPMQIAWFILVQHETTGSVGFGLISKLRGTVPVLLHMGYGPNCPVWDGLADLACMCI